MRQLRRGRTCLAVLGCYPLRCTWDQNTRAVKESDFDWHDSRFPEWLQHKHVVEQLYNFLAQDDVVEEEDEEGNDKERLLPAA